MNTIGTDAAQVPLPVGQCFPGLTLIGQQKRLEQRRRPPLAAALGPGGLVSTRCAVSPASPQGGQWRSPSASAPWLRHCPPCPRGGPTGNLWVSLRARPIAEAIGHGTAPARSSLRSDLAGAMPKEGRKGRWIPRGPP